ncbi:hypothetical protein TIFTF001_021116 [Ficus carica]|uniref:Uncharacterized protein n=1 Tax=Ficus carica TaxID=3494 RepID=A0AA88DJR0_FICCA|nr:hypothetical protein TIFTF001_021116 [Ficus carica]
MEQHGKKESGKGELLARRKQVHGGCCIGHEVGVAVVDEYGGLRSDNNVECSLRPRRAEVTRL